VGSLAAAALAFLLLLQFFGVCAWVSEGGSPAQDFSAPNSVRSLRLVWRRQFYSTTLPVVVGDKIFLGNDSGVACFSVDDGRMLWFTGTRFPVHTILYFEGKVYAGTMRALYCISPSGNIVWVREGFDDMNVYVGGDGKIVLGSMLADSSGKLLRKWNGTVDAAAFSGANFYLALNGTLLASLKSSGEVNWIKNLGERIRFVSCTGAGAGERVFAVASGRTFCFDSGGNILWTVPGTLLSHGLFGGSYVLVFSNKNLEVRDLNGNILYSNNMIVLSATVANDIVYVVDTQFALTMLASGFTLYDTFSASCAMVAVEGDAVIGWSPSDVAVFKRGTFSLKVRVLSDNVPVEGATVVVTDGNGVSSIEYTGSSGVAQFTLERHGLSRIEVRKSGYYKASDYVEVVPGNSAEVTLYISKIVSSSFSESGGFDYSLLISLAVFSMALAIIAWRRT